MVRQRTCINTRQECDSKTIHVRHFAHKNTQSIKPIAWKSRLQIVIHSRIAVTKVRFSAGSPHKMIFQKYYAAHQPDCATEHKTKRRATASLSEHLYVSVCVFLCACVCACVCVNARSNIGSKPLVRLAQQGCTSFVCGRSHLHTYVRQQANVQV